MTTSVLRIVVALGLALLATARATEAQDPADLQSAEALRLLSEASRLFDEEDFEAALPKLDAVVLAFGMALPTTPSARPHLVKALEYRARARFGTADVPGARLDFATLLSHAPEHPLPPTVSPEVAALFEEVRASALGVVDLDLQPADADLEVNGQARPPGTRSLRLPAGTHSLTARRVGYRPLTKTQLIEAGQQVAVAMVLERTAAVVGIMTSPEGVDVTIDGARRGRTEPGPPPEHLRDHAQKLGVEVHQLSKPLVLELAPGPHQIEFMRPCYLRRAEAFTIETMTDMVYPPARLEPATGVVLVETSAVNATTYLNGEGRGPAPMRLENICEGAHVVEVRAPGSRAFRRVDLKAGETVRFAATPHPAVALTGVTGRPERLRGAADVRLVFERELAGAPGLTIFAPEAADTSAALTKAGVQTGWLAFDALTQPQRDPASAMTEADRVDRSRRLADDLSVQGVAELFLPGDVGVRDAFLSLLASGSGRPDVISVGGAREEVNRSLGRLASRPQLYRRTTSLTLVDVVDSAGPRVFAVSPDSDAARAGIKPGDVITQVDGKAVADAAQFLQALERSAPGSTVAIEARDGAGTIKQAAVPAIQLPQLSPLEDESLLSNVLIMAYRHQLVAAKPGPEATILRLNLAMALMRVHSWELARGELEQVTLHEGAGVSQGTVQYLLGLCFEQLSLLDLAEEAYRRASGARGALVTDDGPPVDELATQRLTELRRGRTRPGP